MEKLSVIVPCFNEQETLQDYYDAISKVRETLLGKECELQVILVDDGSNDKTLAKMKELSGQCSWIRYISFTRNFGKEAAIYALPLHRLLPSDPHALSFPHLPRANHTFCVFPTAPSFRRFSP